MDKAQKSGPVVLVVMDGVGLAPDGPGNAVAKARTPFLGKATKKGLHLGLEASGEAVGLTPGQMGNSEVGHNVIGTGQAVKQGIAQIDEAFENGEVFESEAWKEAIKKTKSVANKEEKNDAVGYGVVATNIAQGATLHFAGIFSDGGVHSDINHLEAMVEQAYNEGVRKMRVHVMLDGRDVPPQSEPKYIKRFEEFVKQFKDADIKIASGGGRETTTSDRYEKDWEIVRRGFDMMVHGKAEHYFRTATDAIKLLREENPEIQDQDLPAFVIVDKNREPVGKVKNGDVMIYFDFRKDRAIEIAQAFTYWDFPYFDRGDYRPDEVYFVGLSEYNSDTHVPEHQLVKPIEFHDSLHEFLGQKGISQLAVSETIKFGHITYYFDGNSYEKAAKEEFLEIKTFDGPYAERPWMRSAEITDAVVSNLANYQFVRVNFPNGDMVGHTADLEATIIAMEAVDMALARIAKEVEKLNGILIITADHGNAEELIEDGVLKTSHTTNRVPCIIYNSSRKLANVENPSLKNLAATVATLFNLNDFPKSWGKSLIK